jgi:hypothetical protein
VAFFILHSFFNLKQGVNTMEAWLKSYIESLRKAWPGLNIAMQEHPGKNHEEEYLELTPGSWLRRGRGWLMEVHLRYFPGAIDTMDKGLKWIKDLHTLTAKFPDEQGSFVHIKNTSWSNQPLHIKGVLSFRHFEGAV